MDAVARGVRSGRAGTLEPSGSELPEGAFLDPLATTLSSVEEADGAGVRETDSTPAGPLPRLSCRMPGTRWGTSGARGDTGGTMRIGSLIVVIWLVIGVLA